MASTKQGDRHKASTRDEGSNCVPEATTDLTCTTTANAAEWGGEAPNETTGGYLEAQPPWKPPPPAASWCTWLPGPWCLVSGLPVALGLGPASCQPPQELN